jgi:hypothetical protein
MEVELQQGATMRGRRGKAWPLHAHGIAQQTIARPAGRPGKAGQARAEPVPPLRIPRPAASG